MKEEHDVDPTSTTACPSRTEGRAYYMTPSETFFVDDALRDARRGVLDGDTSEERFVRYSAFDISIYFISDIRPVLVHDDRCATA